MVLKGIVSSTEAAGVRVSFPNKDDIVSVPLPLASNVGAVEVGNKVAVVFFENNMQDGLILAKY